MSSARIGKVWSLKLNCMDSAESVELLLTGWIRRYEQDYRTELPDALKSIIFLYFPMIIEYKGKFTKETVNKRIQLINEYKIRNYYIKW